MPDNLAPYTNAMRLGMGFNSYSQQLCCDDSVVTSSTAPAKETDLVSQPLQADPSTQGSQLVSNGGVTQMVTWTAKFVDRISDVTEAMDINGSASIKYGRISGSASGSFVDSSKFKTSDLNFFIQVNVINQKLVAQDVTQFNPIQSAKAMDFNKLYGDSFISGFIEGGQFNAVISVKLADRDKTESIKGQLSVSANFAVISGQIDASGSYDKNDSLQNNETTMSVTWSGGGNVTPSGIKDWDMASLKETAVNFPAMVAAAPVRTSAILTKYTSLRSFYEQTVLGSPLDYENAGVYTSALLDAYLEYKSIWTDVQVGQWKVQNLGSTITAKQLPLPADELSAYAKTLQDHYQSKLVKAKLSSPSTGPSVDGFEQVTVSEDTDGAEKPMKPNPCIPYPPDLLGLDKARLDCRFEMIKIVQEVDVITINPLLATDPSRANNYLSPLVFRMLLPFPNFCHHQTPSPYSYRTYVFLLPFLSICSLTCLRTTNDDATKAAAAVKSELEATKRDLASKQAELDATKRDLAAKQAELDASKKDLASKMSQLVTAQAASQDAQAYLANEATYTAAQAAAHANSPHGTNAVNTVKQTESIAQNRAVLPPRPNTRLYISTVIWGGKALTDQSVLDRLYKLGECKTPFTLDNQVFGIDPTPGRVKTASISYRWGLGPVLHIEEKEQATVSFKE